MVGDVLGAQRGRSRVPRRSPPWPPPAHGARPRPRAEEWSRRRSRSRSRRRPSPRSRRAAETVRARDDDAVGDHLDRHGRRDAGPGAAVADHLRTRPRSRVARPTAGAASSTSGSRRRSAASSGCSEVTRTRNGPPDHVRCTTTTDAGSADERLLRPGRPGLARDALVEPEPALVPVGDASCSSQRSTSGWYACTKPPCRRWTCALGLADVVPLERLPGGGQRGRAVGCRAGAWRSRPARVVVELEPLDRDAAEDHRAEPSVAEREGVRPQVRGGVVAQGRLGRHGSPGLPEGPSPRWRRSFRQGRSGGARSSAGPAA